MRTWLQKIRNNKIGRDIITIIARIIGIILVWFGGMWMAICSYYNNTASFDTMITMIIGGCFVIGGALLTQINISNNINKEE